MNLYIKINQDLRGKRKNNITIGGTVYNDGKFQLTQRSFDGLVKSFSDLLKDTTIFINEDGSIKENT
jgi:Holliday junction resolvase RusA-like endonuclease